MKRLVPIFLALTACAQAASDSYKVTWSTPSQDSVDSMPLSGRLGAGANVWVQDGSIWLYLAHNRAYDSFYRSETRKRTGKELGDDGKLVIYPGNGLEYAGDATNPLDGVSGLLALTDGLLRYLKLPAADRQRLERIRDTLPPLPTAKRQGRLAVLPGTPPGSPGRHCGGSGGDQSTARALAQDALRVEHSRRVIIGADDHEAAGTRLEPDGQFSFLTEPGPAHKATSWPLPSA